MIKEVPKPRELKPEHGPEGARQALRDLANDPTLKGVMIISLHGDEEPARFSCSNMTLMERCWAEKILVDVNTKALRE